jgi:hypothetical protein
MVPDVDRESSNWYVLLAGLSSPEAEVHLASGLTLRPLAAVPSVFDLAAAGAAGFRQWAAIEPFASLCTCEIESSFDGTASAGYDTLNRAWLATSLLVLRGFTTLQGIACSTYSWGEVAGYQKRSSEVRKRDILEKGVETVLRPSSIDLSPFHGQVLDYHFRLFPGKGPRSDAPNSEDAAWTQQYFETANHLAATAPGFRLALECAVDWRYSKEPRSAIARLWTGIESMFAVQTELVFRISLLAASLLEPRGYSRRARFAATKKLYNLRSKAVHGASLPESALADGLDETFRLLRDLVLVSLARGKVFDEEDLENVLLA